MQFKNTLNQLTLKVGYFMKIAHESNSYFMNFTLLMYSSGHNYSNLLKYIKNISYTT